MLKTQNSHATQYFFCLKLLVRPIYLKNYNLKAILRLPVRKVLTSPLIDSIHGKGSNFYCGQPPQKIYFPFKSDGKIGLTKSFECWFRTKDKFEGNLEKTYYTINLRGCRKGFFWSFFIQFFLSFPNLVWFLLQVANIMS